MRLLIIEDDLGMQETMGNYLSDYELTFVSEINTASRIIGKQGFEFDLIITDINVPGTGGGERILSEASSREIEAFVYTGDTSKSESFYKSAGASKVFYKPTQLPLLADAVRMYEKKPPKEAFRR
ncbi:MAG: response regulator [Pseudobacteriovorax sp.]|nr:response regulator [Pseudobacteriovorax sp.]